MSLPKPQSITIERSVVFDDPEWGNGMHDRHYLRAIVRGDAIYLMTGDRSALHVADNIEFGVDEARAIAGMLSAAADELETQQLVLAAADELERQERDAETPDEDRDEDRDVDRDEDIEVVSTFRCPKCLRIYSLRHRNEPWASDQYRVCDNCRESGLKT